VHPAKARTAHIHNIHPRRSKAVNDELFVRLNSIGFVSLQRCTLFINRDVPPDENIKNPPNNLDGFFLNNVNHD